MNRNPFYSLLAAVVLPMSASAAVVHNPNNGHLYEVVLQPGLTWAEAEAAASARPGDWRLATITDAAENAFIESLLIAGDPAYFDNCIGGTLAGTICRGLWIGGFSSTNSSNDWQWVTGEAFTFSDWGPAEPFSNGDRIRIDEFRSRGQMAWNDVPIGRIGGTGYIVESVVPIPGAVWLFSSGLIGLLCSDKRVSRNLTKKRRNPFGISHSVKGI